MGTTMTDTLKFPHYVYIGYTERRHMIKIGRGAVVSDRAHAWGIDIVAVKQCANREQGHVLEQATLKFVRSLGVEQAKGREWFKPSMELIRLLSKSFDLFTVEECLEIFSGNNTMEQLRLLAPEIIPELEAMIECILAPYKALIAEKERIVERLTAECERLQREYDERERMYEAQLDDLRLARAHMELELWRSGRLKPE